MRCLNRNKTPFWYALYRGKQSVTDDFGYETGETDVLYSEPVRTKGNISPVTGQTTTLQFGENEAYDNVIVLDTPDTPIDEYAVMWIGTEPPHTGENGYEASGWNYVVKKVARSLNSVSIAVSKVSIDG